MHSIAIFFWGLAAGLILMNIIDWLLDTARRDREAEALHRSTIEEIDRAIAAIDVEIARIDHDART